MKKQKNLIAWAFILPLVIAVLSSLVSCGNNYSPADNHVKYILDKHNDNCRFEAGECTQPLCYNYPSNL